jgi:hypothetical protein
MVSPLFSVVILLVGGKELGVMVGMVGVVTMIQELQAWGVYPTV